MNTKTGPGRGGRPQFQPTQAQRHIVEVGAGFGIPHDELRLAVLHQITNKPIDAKTLRKHFNEELANGRAKVKVTVAGYLLAAAKPDKNGKGAAERIFLGKTVLGLRETNALELTGRDGGPIETKGVSAVERLAGVLAGIAKRKREN